MTDIAHLFKYNANMIYQNILRSIAHLSNDFIIQNQMQVTA